MAYNLTKKLKYLSCLSAEPLSENSCGSLKPTAILQHVIISDEDLINPRSWVYIPPYET